MATTNYPRAKIVINGQTFIPDTVNFTASGYFHGDKLDTHLPMFSTSIGTPFWTGLGYGAPIQVFGGDASSGTTVWESTPFFDGLLNEIDLDFDTGKASLTCVDRVQLLQQLKLYQTFPNQTGAEIISNIAGQVGMTAQVTGDTHLAGILYSKDHIKLQHGDLSKVTTGWDLISYIARETGNVAFVKGTVVYVQPLVIDPTNGFTVIYKEPTTVGQVTTWTVQSNVWKLHLKHSLLVSKDITVQVNYFHSKKGVAGKATAGPVRSKSNMNQSNFIYAPYANINADQAQAKANSIYRELTLHEWTLDFETAMDFSVLPYQTVAIPGLLVGQMFYINELTFHIDQTAGGTMSLVCKTHQPENDTNA